MDQVDSTISENREEISYQKYMVKLYDNETLTSNQKAFKALTNEINAHKRIANAIKRAFKSYVRTHQNSSKIKKLNYHCFRIPGIVTSQAA